jgi:MFS transporter, BCD family, chlorophyll transporter
MGATLAYRATGYGTVYALEILLLLVTLVVLGPVIGLHLQNKKMTSEGFGLSEFPT